MRLGHVVHWPPGPAASGSPGLVQPFPSNSESGRDRYRRLCARTIGRMPCSGLRAARPLETSGRGAASPRSGQPHGFVKSRSPSSQLVLVLVLVINLDLVRILVQDLVILVLDI